MRKRGYGKGGHGGRAEEYKEVGRGRVSVEGKRRKERDGGGRGGARRRKNIIDAAIYVKIKPTGSS